MFVLDMGEPVRISDLARTMVHLYGKKLSQDTGNPNDIEITVEGLRPGEKLFEELFISDKSQPTEVAKITTTKEHWMEWSALDARLKSLSALAAKADSAAIRVLLLELAFIGENHTGEVSETGAIQHDVPTNAATEKVLSSVR